ncbi:hypothetical protein GYMLUDRAFT_37450 [Collybiopsis luxurians FD-317 M1]|nr:hypothetical protein GYMLUDRAFT_37450 [Collybiopsis luxurians FD-317 M1]
MFAPPDYSDPTLYPPTSHAPSNRTDAYALHMLQKLMADSYVEGRKYWAASSDGGPNPAQAEVEKFLEFTGLLSKRERLSEIQEVSQPGVRSDCSSEAFADAQDSTIPKESPRHWRRYISLPSGSSPSFLRLPRSRMRAMSVPLFSKIQRPPFPLPKRLQRLSKTLTPLPLMRTISEPRILPSSFSPFSLMKKPRRMTMDESQMTTATSRVADTSVAPLSPSILFPVHSPRLPCDYLPLIQATSRKRRKRPVQTVKRAKSAEPFALPFYPVQARPLTCDRNPPPGSPLSVRKFPLPPPEWFDTPFDKEPSAVREQSIEEDKKYPPRWYEILLFSLGTFLLLIVVILTAILFVLLEIILSPATIFCALCEDSE